ncbi:junctional cadherin 5-associated protein isoform X1 [Arvicanthis niloticus]|uniref:junctional cadherin 5-associated protein isoform X1 n=1 Tax=Arvicanthis niloticus TaxID=61156 RepID=UPI00148741E7|nr:junctional protein associated with coronary artery disease [Arvicanthis niloticus]
MYSVEDLLISHGYKPARDATAPREDKSERCKSTRTEPRAGQGLLNGYRDGPTAHAHSRTSLGTGHVSNSENRSSKPRGHREHRSASSRTPEAGFLNQPSLAWSSQPQRGRDDIYWSRGRQEGSGSLCPRDRKELESRGMAQTHSLPIHVRESPWEVAGRTEHVIKNAVWEEELRMPTPTKGEDVSLGSWKQPRKLGRQASDGDGQKRSQERFEDLYQFVHGEPMLASQTRKKAQSLPRALSPKGLNFTEIPVPLYDGHISGIPKAPSYPPSCPPPLEPTRNLEKAGPSGPFPRPKFGKPLKTLCYGSHSQPRGEGGFQDHQHREPRGSYPTRSKDPSHELGMLDTGLEPPVYVPPPSYRSPPQHIPNPYLEDPVPRHVSSGQSQQQQLPEKPEASCPLPSGSLAARDLYDAMPGSPPQGLPPHPYPLATHGSSIQYIPFDDPRIRHIKLAQPPEFYEEAKLDGTSYNSSFITTQEPALGKRQYDDALSAPRGSTPPPVSERGSAFAHSSPQWLQGQLSMGIEPGGFPSQTEHHVMRGLTTDMRDSRAESYASSPQPPSEGTCKTYTKLRKFETGIQSKKNSKKKSNATIFCLVSVPVKSESLGPDTDTNNNDLKLGADTTHGLCQGPALEEQSLLSMSSSDLELQALMGSTAWRRASPRHGLGESEDSRTDDPRILHLIRPKELQASGSWPGHQYRDQQTQTSFPEDSKSSQPLPATKPGEASKAAPTPMCPDTTASEVQLHAALASSDPNQKPSGPHLRGQMSLSPSQNSAFSRTSSAINQASMPKGASDQLPSASPVPKPEVVKGESTTGQCNSTQLFGQFLLKPVSRRPWDLISQLESFNKELQEEEESHGASSGGSSDNSEAEQPEDSADSRAKSWGHQETRTEQWLAGLPLEDAASPEGRLNESQNWSEEPKPGHPCAHPQSSGPSQEEDSRGVPAQQADGSLTAEQKSQEVLNGTCEGDISPRPVSRIAPVDTKAAPFFCLTEPRGSQELTKVSSALGSVQLGRETPTKVDSDGDTEVLPCVLPFADKYGGLSTPDFRSLELTLGQEQRAYKSEYLGLENTMEVLPSESLQERAERILGIEVAVESLLPGARRTEQSQLPEPDASTCGPRSSREDSLSSLAPTGAPMVATDAFYGRRKCGWTESPLFVGERAPQASVCSDVEGFPASQAPSPEPEKNEEEAKPPFKSTLFHFMEKSTHVVGPEKRLRNPSKVIESLQEKLVSPPKRADSVRLIRMREVNSLSQMRGLSSKSADSMEEPDPLKGTKSPAWLSEGLTSPSGKDQAWQAGHLPSVSQNENGHPEVPREKMSDHDLWCADSYDPSRVERV